MTISTRGTRGLRSHGFFACCTSMAIGLLLSMPMSVSAQSYNVLKECTSHSSAVDDIHACLDNYLDIMDDNINDISTFLERSLDGASLAGFQQSQSAFNEYRRANCLWYLEFSSPRGEAEQIAKNCLATMSQQRLSELQRLMAADDSSSPTLRGFYVYGASRNSFQPCADSARYWVEGDNNAVSQLQQQYLNTATADLQVLYVTVKGDIDAQSQTTAGHAGVLKLADIVELRVPREGDCRLPSNQAPDLPAVPAATAPAASITEPDNSQEVVDSTTQEEPQQQLIAYFGDWTADCIENEGNRRCELTVGLNAKASNGSADAMPELELARRSRERTAIELRFPDREVDSPARIRWGVDGYIFGDIVGSSIRVDQSATRQLVRERRFIQQELLPLMIDGSELSIEVLASIDDTGGEQFVATLRGLTRALAFADEFVRDGG